MDLLIHDVSLPNQANRQQETVEIQRTLMTGLAGGWWVLHNMELRRAVWIIETCQKIER